MEPKIAVLSRLIAHFTVHGALTESNLRLCDAS